MTTIGQDGILVSLIVLLIIVILSNVIKVCWGGWLIISGDADEKDTAFFIDGIVTFLMFLFLFIYMNL